MANVVLILKIKGFDLKDEDNERMFIKIQKLERFVDKDIDVKSLIRLTASNDYKVYVSFMFCGKYIKGEGISKESPLPAFYDAVDDAIRQIRKTKTNRFEKQGDKIVEHLIEDKNENEPSMHEFETYGLDSDRITKEKLISLHPITIDEAIDEMELYDRDFFMFQNIENDICVVFKRKNGYGLIKAE